MKRSSWTREEDEFLRKNYHILSIEEMSKRLSRTKSAIESRHSRLKTGNTRHYARRFFTKEVRTLIFENHHHMADEEISNKTGIPRRTITEYRLSLGIYKKRVSPNAHKGLGLIWKDGASKATNTWSKEEEFALTEFFGIVPIKDLAKFLNRTEGSVYAKANRIKNHIREPKGWTKEDEEVLINQYGKEKTSNLSKLLGRTSRAINEKARVLGLAVPQDGRSKRKVKKKWWEA